VLSKIGGNCLTKLKTKYIKNRMREVDKTVDQLGGQRTEERKSVQSGAKVS
jgi:hypothetical protein